MTMRVWILVGAAGLGALTAGIAVVARHGDAAVSSPTPSHVRGERVPVDRSVQPGRSAFSRRGSGPATQGEMAEVGDRIGDTDPTSREYDPVTITLATHAKPSELLKKEPRNPTFADSREAELRGQLVERLQARLPFETKLDVDCHTSACELTVHGAHGVDQMNAVLEAIEPSRLADSAEIASIQVPDDPEARGIQVTLLYSAALRERAAYEQWLRQHPPHDR